MQKINLDKSYEYSKFIADTKAFETKYYPLLKNRLIGVSHDGRDITMLKVGYGKKAMLCSSGIHGNDSFNPVILMKIIETFCELYSQKETLKSKSLFYLLEEYSIYFVPILNPDGYTVVTQGYDFIRNEYLRAQMLAHNIPHTDWRYNARGIDINRNFPSINYKPSFYNDYGGSEKETMALVHGFQKISTIGYLNFMSYGKKISYYNAEMSMEYNDYQRLIAKDLSKMTGYEVVKELDDMNTQTIGGRCTDYYSESIGGCSLTIQTFHENKHPANTDTMEKIYEEVIQILVSYLKLLSEYSIVV